ncbi:MAG: response regulator [Gammaproteobacteria bacterium]|nr:response regulator [Gammaproteobacteria bacterium]
MANKEYDFATGKIVDLDKRKAVILINDSSLADPLIELLRKSRYRMLGMTSKPDVALELVRKHKVGVIFIDADIPGINVHEILIHLQRRFPAFNPIMLSDQVSKADIVTVSNLGAVGFLTKPLQEESIRRGMSQVTL